jgi:hypothetical protein
LIGIMSLDALARCCPIGAEFRSINAHEAEIDLVAERSSKAFTRLFQFKVDASGKEIVVSERPVGSTLPACCPERHINLDGSFCIGLRAGVGITDETAPAWWKKLHAFALWQETAAETGFWPSEAQLSHGEAAVWELAAEKAAEQLGLRSVYREAVAFDTGIIAVGVAKVSTKTGMLRNGRSACICGRIDRRGRPLLRRDCRSVGPGCPILFEHRRRVSIDDFWRELRGHVACCGTMRECPLRTGDATTDDGRTLHAAETHEDTIRR